jgi:SAM-dependent methyltransferase
MAQIGSMPLIVSRRAFVAGLAWAGPALALQSRREPEVPYVPTPPEVVEAMLNLAGLRAGEQLVDLGSGDGRIVLAAARRGAQARGVELDPELVERARRRAEFERLQDRARFVRGDLFAESLRDAQVVTLYLLPAVNARLRPKLLTELKAGSRVVSHAFDMGDWTPDQMQVVEDKQLYLWIVPAVAGGAWRLTLAPGKSGLLDLTQTYQQVTGTFDGRPVEGISLRGARLFFRIDGVDRQGLVGDRTIEPDPGADYLPSGWSAERVQAN